jgi:predicted nucleic acid-binding protein
VILVDTSVWVEHLRRRNSTLANVLGRGEAACHPFVIGELSLGWMRKRAEILALLSDLPATTPVRHEEAMALVEQRDLSGTGLGWVDVHLLASALVEGWTLWSLDKRLQRAARSLGAAWDGASS